MKLEDKFNKTELQKQCWMCCFFTKTIINTLSFCKNPEVKEHAEQMLDLEGIEILVKRTTNASKCPEFVFTVNEDIVHQIETLIDDELDEQEALKAEHDEHENFLRRTVV